MYLHLGQDFIVNTRDVIGVFDLDTATDAGQKAKITDEFLRHAQQEGAVVDVSGSMPKSFVLTDFPDADKKASIIFTDTKMHPRYTKGQVLP